MADAQGLSSTPASAVLVELFTSEGCSSCPPADELLGQVNGQKTAQGQLVIGFSEHVSYWNGLGWKDPFSADPYTTRQSAYSSRFHTDGSYTPQMVVNGRTQFVGSDRSGLREALAAESSHKQIQLRIGNVKITGANLSFSYSAEGVSSSKPLQMMAALVDGSDKSSVLRGENSGHSLQHVFVAQALAQVGELHKSGEMTVTFPLPAGFAQAAQPHHLIVFAQEQGLGPIVGVDATAL